MLMLLKGFPKKKEKALNKKAKKLKNNQHITIAKLKENFIETGHYYVQVLDYLREIAHCMTFITEPAFNHVDNQHKGLTLDQTKDLLNLKNHLVEYFEIINQIISSKEYVSIQNALDKQQEILSFINKIRKKQIKRIKAGETGTKVSLLFMDILSETKNMVLHAGNLLKSQRDFVLEHNSFK